LNEIFSLLDVAGSTAIGIVTKPKLIEPFQIGLMDRQTGVVEVGAVDRSARR
jgi:hypothetical protein